MVDLSKYNNEDYRKQLPGIFKRTSWYLINAVFFQNPIFIGNGIKKWLLKVYGAKIGKGVLIKPSVNIKYPWNLKIGDHSWVGEGVWIDNLAPVEIGSNVCISQGAFLLTGNHNYSTETFDLMLGKILIEDGVWIGAKSIVCPGIVCHSHSVLTVMSVANRSLEAYTVYSGNPALAVKKRIISK